MLDTYSMVKDIVLRVCDYMYEKELKKIQEFASKCHNGQIRKGGDIPYIVHPARVASLVKENVNYENTHEFVSQSIAWLHDVVEDCITYQELRDFLYDTVSDDACRLMILHGVACLTEDKSISPRALKHATYMDSISCGEPMFRMIKLADRIDNLLDGGLDKGFIKNVYLSESKDILNVCETNDGLSTLSLRLRQVITKMEK